jgi:hypothetical protein
MDTKYHVALMMTMALFAMGAVAVILYQHAAATQQVLSSLGGTSGGTGGASSLLALPISLAGTPTIGQSGTSSPTAVIPLNINPGYTFG